MSKDWYPPVEEERCATCEHSRYVMQDTWVWCSLYPDWTRQAVTHWCYQFKAKEADDGEMDS